MGKTFIAVLLIREKAIEVERYHEQHLTETHANINIVTCSNIVNSNLS